MQPRVNGRFGQMPLLERLEAKVNKTDSCWNWTGSITSEGYGQIWAEGRAQKAHRVCYELFKGKIPEGLELDHLCRNRACVNPNHLEAVTRQENAYRGLKLRRRTHCKKGHALTEDNVYRWINPYGRPARRCRTCGIARSRVRYALKNGGSDG